MRERPKTGPRKAPWLRWNSIERERGWCRKRWLLFARNLYTFSFIYLYPSSVSRRKGCGDGWNNVLFGVRGRATKGRLQFSSSSTSDSEWTAWISTTSEPSMTVTISETTTADEQMVHSSCISSGTSSLFVCCSVCRIDSPTASSWLDFQQLTVGVCSGDRIPLSPSIVTLSVDIRLFGVNNLKALDDVFSFSVAFDSDIFDGDFVSSGGVEWTTLPFSDGLTTQRMSRQLCRTRYLLSGTPISANFWLNTTIKNYTCTRSRDTFRVRRIARSGEQYLGNDSAWKARQKRATTSF